MGMFTGVEVVLWGIGIALLLGVALYASKKRQQEQIQRDEILKRRIEETKLRLKRKLDATE